jgi:hypothetical protein
MGDVVTLETLVGGIGGEFILSETAALPEFQNFWLSRKTGLRDVVIPMAFVDRKGNVNMKNEMSLHRDHIQAMAQKRKCTLKEWIEQFCGDAVSNVFFSFKTRGHIFVCVYSMTDNIIRFCDSCGAWTLSSDAHTTSFTNNTVQKIANALYDRWSLPEMPILIAERRTRELTATRYCYPISNLLLNKAKEPESMMQLLRYGRPDPGDVEEYYITLSRTDELFSFIAANKKLLVV